MKQNHLFLITNQFPYGIGESFLENEIKFLTDNFDTVIVLSKDVSSEKTRYHADNFFPYRISTKSPLHEILFSPLLFIYYLFPSTKFILSELRHLKKRNKKVTLSIIRKLFHDLFKALVLSRRIKAIIQMHDLKGRITLYSYWLNSSALATVFVSYKKNEIKRIARAHRVDVYEEEHPDKYLTFRSVLAEHLDKIFTVSAHGCEYLQKLIDRGLHQKIQISRLGTLGHEWGERSTDSEASLIVSCSFLREIKRVHLIIEALACVGSLRIHWIHFGDGPLYDQLNTMANDLLDGKPNITFEMYGEISNTELMEYYRNNYVDLFVNTSSSEGIPVTMMEALSFAIPVLALDVGGVSEIVNKAHGRLLPSSATSDDIGRAIDELLSMTPNENEKLRLSARTFWQDNYDASVNYAEFVKTLRSLFL